MHLITKREKRCYQSVNYRTKRNTQLFTLIDCLNSLSMTLDNYLMYSREKDELPIDDQIVCFAQ